MANFNNGSAANVIAFPRSNRMLESFGSDHYLPSGFESGYQPDRLDMETRHGEPDAEFCAGLAATEDHLGEALDFIRHNYRQVGYAAPDSLTPTATESVTALAKRHGKVIGTLSLWRDGAAGLQADEIYAEELDQLRLEGARIGELGRLAMDSRTPALTLLFSLLGKIARAGVQWELTDFVVECNPRHAGFYKKMLGFSVLAGKRECSQVGAPAVLLRVAASHLLHLTRQYGSVARVKDSCDTAHPAQSTVTNAKVVPLRRNHSGVSATEAQTVAVRA